MLPLSAVAAGLVDTPGTHFSNNCHAHSQTRAVACQSDRDYSVAFTLQKAFPSAISLPSSHRRPSNRASTVRTGQKGTEHARFALQMEQALCAHDANAQMPHHLSNPMEPMHEKAQNCAPFSHENTVRTLCKCTKISHHFVQINGATSVYTKMSRIVPPFGGAITVHALCTCTKSHAISLH